MSFPNHLAKRLRQSWQRNSLLRNTLWMLLSQGLRLVLQAGYFVIIARTLGAEQYGAFVGVTAFVAIAAPFATLGGGNLLIKNVARNRALFSEYWGNALVLISGASLVLALLLMFLAPRFLPTTISPLLLVLALVADLVCFRLIDTAAQSYQAVMWLSKTAQLNLLPSILRLLAALALQRFFVHPNAETWMLLYVASTVIAAVIAVGMVQRDLGRPHLGLQRILPELREGVYFSVSQSSQTIYNDIDKTMLTRLASLEAAGVYAAAYRLIDVAFVPIKSLLAAAYAKFFQRGATGVAGSLGLAKQLAPMAGGYGLVAALGLWLGAPVIPLVLGPEYAPTVDVLRWLAPLPLLKALHYFAADTLTGAGFQSLRSIVQIGVAGVNVALNLWLIPRYGWRGAAGSSLVTDGLLLISLVVMVTVVYQRQQRSRAGLPATH
jgi:O-antigen/teichoic acid export membrane protein